MAENVRFFGLRSDILARLFPIVYGGGVLGVAVTAGDSERELIVFTGDGEGNVYCFDYVEPGEGVGR